MSEAEVAFWLKRALIQHGIGGRAIRDTDVIVDADGSYKGSPFARHLQPFGVHRIGDRRPDLLALTTDGVREQVLAFEVKGEYDHEKGVVQAATYRLGAHAAYLCVPRPSGTPAPWLMASVRKNGVGLVLASPDGIECVWPPEEPVPNPDAAAGTRRFLQGERTLRPLDALGLNRPLHYVAALVASATEARPAAALVEKWGLGATAVPHAVRGATIFGFLRDVHGVTPWGWALAESFLTSGFRLDRSTRTLTGHGKRLVSDAPAFAALLRTSMLTHPAVALTIRALERCGGHAHVRQLVTTMAELDEGMGAALFGGTSDDAAVPEWLPRPSTVYQLKSMLYDVGILDSRLAKGAANLTTGEYEPGHDVWSLGHALRSLSRMPGVTQRG